MKITAATLATLLLVGCLGDADSWPTTPTTTPDRPTDPPPLKPVWVWGMVVASGICLDEATVQVVAGQGLGRSGKQTCNIWDDDGWGFVFDGLTEGSAITILAAVPGYRSVELTIVPQPRQTDPIIIMLEKM